MNTASVVQQTTTQVDHAHAVHGLPFEQLSMGMSVDLDIEAGHAGQQATRVTPHNIT